MPFRIPFRKPASPASSEDAFQTNASGNDESGPPRVASEGQEQPGDTAGMQSTAPSEVDVRGLQQQQQTHQARAEHPEASDQVQYSESDLSLRPEAAGDESATASNAYQTSGSGQGGVSDGTSGGGENAFYQERVANEAYQTGGPTGDAVPMSDAKPSHYLGQAYASSSLFESAENSEGDESGSGDQVQYSESDLSLRPEGAQDGDTDSIKVTYTEVTSDAGDEDAQGLAGTFPSRGVTSEAGAQGLENPNPRTDLSAATDEPGSGSTLLPKDVTEGERHSLLGTYDGDSVTDGGLGDDDLTDAEVDA